MNSANAAKASTLIRFTFGAHSFQCVKKAGEDRCVAAIRCLERRLGIGGVTFWPVDRGVYRVSGYDVQAEVFVEGEAVFEGGAP